MKVQLIKNINVLPVFIGDFNPIFILNCLKSIDRQLNVHDYHIVENGAILLLTGNVGNELDNLLIKLSNVKSIKGELAYFTRKRALKIACTLNDEEYNSMIKNGYAKNIELNDDLTSIYN